MLKKKINKSWNIKKNLPEESLSEFSVDVVSSKLSEVLLSESKSAKSTISCEAKEVVVVCSGWGGNSSFSSSFIKSAKKTTSGGEEGWRIWLKSEPVKLLSWSKQGKSKRVVRKAGTKVKQVEKEPNAESGSESLWKSVNVEEK